MTARVTDGAILRLDFVCVVKGGKGSIVRSDLVRRWSLSSFNDMVFY